MPEKCNLVKKIYDWAHFLQVTDFKYFQHVLDDRLTLFGFEKCSIL